MHSLLAEQLQRLGLSRETLPSSPEQWTAFLACIDHVYEDRSGPGAERDRLSEEIRTEQEFRTGEARIRSIIDTALDAVVGMDAQGRIIDWNRPAEAMFGWSREEAVGRDLAETIIPAAMRERHKEGMARFLATGEGPVLNRRIEVLALRRDGAEFPIELAISPLKIGASYLFNAFIEDITERKRAESELRQAKEQAEANARAKSDFLANMSHEIRTPMNGILGMTELLLHTSMNDKQRMLAETAHRSGTALLQVLNDILDFSKIEAGKLDLQSVDFDLRETVEEAVGLLAEQAHARGLELAYLIVDSVPTGLRGDPGRIRQILLNLIGNAVKFTEKGEVVVEVKEVRNAGFPMGRVPRSLDGAVAESGSVPEGQVLLRFSITDTGIGIPVEAQPRIFEAFAQADGSITRRYGGTGLGLAIVKQLVEMMGGAVGLRSQPGLGSTFWFTLSLPRQSGEVQSVRGVAEDLAGVSALVVDDNAINRTIFKHHLEGWGMKQDGVASGPVALEILRNAANNGTPFQVVLLDRNMPGMDGLTLARAIKADETLGQVRLILVTSHHADGDIGAAGELGIESTLIKPVRQADLKRCLSRVLSRSHPAPVSPPVVPSTERFEGYVLLAEDNPVNQEVARGLLEELGCRVDVVSDGGAAVDAWIHGQFDLILMDCQMPGTDGFQATQEIRGLEARCAAECTNGSPLAFPARPRTPIVALTAHALEGYRDQCLAVGMDDYLTKPFNQNQLAAVLKEWLRPHHPAAGPAKPSIDRSVWAQVRAASRPGRPDLLTRAMTLFLGHSRQLVGTIREAVALRDLKSVRAAAHSLKSSSGSLGAVRLSLLSKSLEEMGGPETAGQALELVRELEAEYAAVSACFEEEIMRCAE